MWSKNNCVLQNCTVYLILLDLNWSVFRTKQKYRDGWIGFSYDAGQLNTNISDHCLEMTSTDMQIANKCILRMLIQIANNCI